MAEAIYRLQNVDFSYPDGSVGLASVSLDIAEGESVALLGANASGKSTLLHLMDGLYFASHGVVEAFGVPLNDGILDRGNFAVEFRKRVGYLFQNPDIQLFCPSVEEELSFGPMQLGIKSEQLRRRIEDVTALCDIRHLMKKPPHRLSGGEKKRVALASVLAVGPSVLLLDEPTAGLDPRTESWLVETLRELHAAGKTLILSTHDLHFASEIADRAVVLSEDHQIAGQGPVEDIAKSLDLLLQANLIRTHTHRDRTTHVHPVHGEH